MPVMIWSLYMHYRSVVVSEELCIAGHHLEEEAQSHNTGVDETYLYC